jgi:hypothetical protein
MWNALKLLSVCLEGFSLFLAFIRRKPLFAVLMYGFHFLEFLAVGRKEGKKAGTDTVPSLISCLLFGFAWWMPLQKKNRQ